MRLIKGSFAGLVLAGILAMMPAPAFAHGGGGGGGHAFVGGGHAFGGFSGRGFSPGFSGTRDLPLVDFLGAEIMASHRQKIAELVYIHSLYLSYR